MTLEGKTIGRYRIIEQLGQGGMAVVYRAFDTRLERYVAIKVIRTGDIPQNQFEHFLKRFEREAKTQSKFNHPNIVQIHDYGEFEGAPYLVMSYRPGGTLKKLIGSPIPYQQAAKLLAPIADALAYAHKFDVLHRDVKPSNILLSEDGPPVLTDFGIAKLLGDVDEATLTNTGMGVGTPQYMAPEQWRGNPVKATDIYALGVVFYELITGHKPYDADTPAALAIIQATEPLTRPTNFVSDLPDHVERVLFKALAPDPKDRYPSMAAFAEVLVKLSQEKATVPTPQMEESKEEEPEIPPVDAPIKEDVQTFDKSETERQPKSKPKKPFKMPSWIWGLIGLAVFAGIVFGVMQFSGGGIPTAEITPEATEKIIPTNTNLPEPTQIGGGSGKIAFTSDRNGNNDIWLMDIDGSNLIQLTNDPADDWNPIWSPDGSKIAFNSTRSGSREIWMMDANGENLAQLTDFEAILEAWSPDGRKLLFSSWQGSRTRNIWIIDIDGNNLKQLTRDFSNLASSWSPDGSQITFDAYTTTNYDIWVMDSDGGNLKQLTNDPADNGSPKWSPDGNQIAFVSDRDGNDDIWVMTTDGSVLSQLTNNNVDDGNPDWSPDGDWIIFTSIHSGNSDIWLMNSDGSNLTQLTIGPANDLYPNWQPAPNN